MYKRRYDNPIESRARVTIRDIKVKLRLVLAQTQQLRYPLESLKSSALEYLELGVITNIEQAIESCNQILLAHNAPDVE